MQTSVLTATTCEAIDKRISDFVWGSMEEARNIHLIAWDRVCTPKENGGLGLRLARELNRSFMTKLAYIFFQNKELHWVRVLQSKYFRETNDDLQLRKSGSKSALWRGLSKEWPVMTRGIRSAIKDGRGTSFWLTRWIDSGEMLIDLLDGDPNLINQDDTVADLVGEDGQWGNGIGTSFPLISRVMLLTKLLGCRHQRVMMIGFGVSRVMGGSRFNPPTTSFVIPRRSKSRYCGAEFGDGRVLTKSGILFGS
ncbi:Putative ribonuclease H protein At1g65750 [Linum perenne]